MKFTIHSEVLKKLPEIKLGFLIIHNININIDTDEMAQKLTKSIKSAQKKYKDTQLADINDIIKWREYQQKADLDWKKHPVSIESILNRIVVDQKDIGSINPLVDLYNSISIDTLTPMGAYNLDKIDGDLVLRFAEGNESYHPLSGKGQEVCETGELIFVDQSESLCRYWVHKQSNTHKITPYTKNIIFRIEGIAKSAEEFEHIMQVLEKEIHENFHPGKIETHVATKDNPDFEFEKPKPDETEVKIDQILNRGTAEVIVREDLENKLRKAAEEGTKLRIKLGIDPTGSDLHIGHMVVIKKLKEFQDLGHHILLLFGNFTGQLGDPTGKSETRKSKTQKELEENAKYYLQQAGKVLDASGIEVVWNADWLGKLNFGDVLGLASTFTVAQMLERDMFQDRIKGGLAIGVQEFMYPLMQGYDSVALKADVEIGGTDQTFNLLAGRTIQEAYGQTPQNILTVPILEGLDGKMKMGKSTNNYIGVNESPKEMYGKTMSIPDNLILRYFELATDLPLSEINKIKLSLESGENPRNLKMKLAREIVRFYHSEDEAQEAENGFIKQFREKETPDDILEFIIEDLELNNPANIVELLGKTNLVSSNGEARRLIEGGGVKVNGERINEISAEVELANDTIIQAGKRKFAKLVSTC